MLKRILSAVGVVILGFAIVVIVVAWQLSHVAGIAREAKNVNVPLYSAAVHINERSEEIAKLVAGGFLCTKAGDLAEIRTIGNEALDRLRADVNLLSQDQFAGVHSASVTDQQGKTVTVGEVLQKLNQLVGELSAAAVQSFDLADKQITLRAGLEMERENLSAIYRKTQSLSGLDDKAYAALSRASLVVMYSTSTSDLNYVGRAKYTEAIAAFDKITNLTASDRLVLTSFKVQFEKTLELALAASATKTDYGFFTDKDMEVDAVVNLLRDFAQSELNSGQSTLVSKTASYLAASISLSIITIVVGIIATLFIARSIMSNVATAAQALELVADGDLTTKVKITSKDELGQMAQSLNEMVERLGQNVRNISISAQSLAASSKDLSAISTQVSANCEETSAQATTAAAAAEQVSRNIQTVATSAEEMSASASEIAKSASQASAVANHASEVASKANGTISKLGESSVEIGNVIKVITSIAQQTNLLALNATIEAARAGDSGRGFAVVANEVKELAKQTAKATEEISRKITAIQSDTKGAVDAIQEISGIIKHINELQTTIASAVEEQAATTREISRSAQEASGGSAEIARNITHVTLAAKSTAQGAAQTATASTSLAQLSGELNWVVETFKLEVTPEKSGENPGASSSSKPAATAVV